MNESLLPCVQIDPPGGTARSTVIWLHGLGADGHDFEPIVPELGLDPALEVRFVFPHAPRIPVTINGGMVMPAWYDITGMDLSRRNDEAGIRRSAAQVMALLARENERGVPCARIVLAGFSQGGAIALFQGLRHPDPLAGILALSTYLVLPDALSAERSAVNRVTPIFQAHGTQDPMLPHAAGVQSRDHLRKLGYEVEWHDYPMPHAVCAEEIREIGRWLGQQLAG